VQSLTEVVFPWTVPVGLSAPTPQRVAFFVGLSENIGLVLSREHRKSLKICARRTSDRWRSIRALSSIASWPTSGMRTTRRTDDLLRQSTLHISSTWSSRRRADRRSRCAVHCVAWCSRNNHTLMWNSVFLVKSFLTVHRSWARHLLRVGLSVCQSIRPSVWLSVALVSHAKTVPRYRNMLYTRQ